MTVNDLADAVEALSGISTLAYPRDEEGDQGVQVVLSRTRTRIFTVLEPEVLTDDQKFASWVQVVATVARGVRA